MKARRWFIIALNVCLCVYILWSLGRLLMPRHEKPQFRPSVVGLEPRRVPDGAGSALPDPSGMPNGEDAFVFAPDYTSAGLGLDNLIVDIDGNLATSPFYLSGQVQTDVTPVDPSSPSQLPSDPAIDRLYERMLDSLPPPKE